MLMKSIFLSLIKSNFRYDFFTTYEYIPHKLVLSYVFLFPLQNTKDLREPSKCFRGNCFDKTFSVFLIPNIDGYGGEPESQIQ